jgi:NADH:ubiquinone oxidoreductase subunit 3 (subunit A)
MAIEAHVPDITHVIQLAVAPVFMLTAVGTIINALNSRLGRAVDRRRVLEARLAEVSFEGGATARDELAAINRRIHYVYLAILFAVLSGLFTCLLIAGAFLGAFVATDLTRTVAALFVLAMIALIASLLFFLREIFIAVSAPRHRAQPLAPPNR